MIGGCTRRFALMALVAAAGCGGGETGSRGQAPAADASAPERATRPEGGAAAARGASLRGTRLTPGPRPSFTLTDTGGAPFEFRTGTEDHLALLFFGYTNCPDVCPVHMANLASVIRDLPWELQDRIRVVFVTTDPERDAPEPLREWLDRFDRRFIGLTGDIDEINRIQVALELPVAVRLPAEETGSHEATDDYEVGHAAHVLVFGLDDRTRLAYGFGTRQADWAHDLPLLVTGSAHLPPASD